MKTAVISARASLANAGKHEIHAYNHSPAIVPGVGKTKEEGFSGGIITLPATFMQKAPRKAERAGEKMSGLWISPWLIVEDVMLL